MLIAGLGAGLMQMQASNGKRYSFAIDRRSALYLAEAGLGEAALAVSVGKSGVIASEAQPVAFGGGVYWVDSVDLPDDRIVLTCTARVGTAEIVARTLVLPNVNPVAKLGFFGLQTVELGAGTVVDGYHSGRGTYASQVDTMLPVASTGEHGLVGSDGDVLLLSRLGSGLPLDDLESNADDWLAVMGGSGDGGSKEDENDTSRSATAGDSAAGSHSAPTPTPPTRVYGFVRPGRAGVVQSDGSALISEGIRPFESPPFVPEVTLPDPREVIAGPVLVSGPQAGVGSTAQTEVTGDVTVKAGGVLTLTGPTVLVLDQLLVESGGTLHFDDTSGPIELYSRMGVQLSPGSYLRSLAPDERARGTRIFVSGDATDRDRLAFEATGYFHGVLFAPDDVLRIPASLRWVGGATARVIESEEDAHLTFDRRLAIGGDGLPTLPQMLAWQIIPLGDSIARQLPINPLAELALRGVTPLLPRFGPPELDVSLQYIDTNGAAQTYDGPITGFNPSVANRMVGARWDDPRDGVPRAWATPPGAESTGALEAVREDLSAIRAAILVEAPTSEVGQLTDDEVVLELASVATAGTLTTPPTAVERAVERADDTVATADTAEQDRANKAARTADTLAKDAAAKVDEIRTAPTAVLGADVEAAAKSLIAGLEKEAANARADADRAVDAAVKATTETGAARSTLADKAEKEFAKTEAHIAKVNEYYAELKALGY